MKMKNKRVVALVVALLVMVTTIPMQVGAAETKWNMGSVVNTGKDNGYSGIESIKSDDPHYGWTLGQFYVQGYSGRQEDEDGNPIFLKNVGDEVKLMFDLQQDISKLNSNKNLYICEDTNGYMEKYQIEKTNLKKGTLIIRHTDYQNKVGEPQVYTNYLSAKESDGADTEVLLCEEGDYEVCLIYEIKSDNFLFFDGYNNYKIEFKFSVRNGNTMIFPFDTVTGQELANSSFTENGFYLDLANSHYLTIQVRREVWTKGTDEWVKDTRFNRVVADGEQYTEEGIYTITVTNPYTDATTEKVIYVGTDSLFKAHVVTGLSLEEIEAQVAEGATIDESGNIIPLPASIPDVPGDTERETVQGQPTEMQKKPGDILPIILVIAGLILIGGGACFIYYKKHKKTENEDEIAE